MFETPSERYSEDSRVDGNGGDSEVGGDDRGMEVLYTYVCIWCVE